MIKSLFMAFAITMAAVVAGPKSALAGQFYKCNVNGAIHYQQGPCQASQPSKRPSIEELNAQRKKQLALEKENAPTQRPQQRTGPIPERAQDTDREVTAPQKSSFKCDSRKYCTQMTSCAEAQYFLSNCPGVKMDGDGDGLPCEDQLCGH